MIGGVITILKNDSAVQSLIGQNKGEDKYKVYPGICPQPERPPYIVVRKTGNPPLTRCKGAVPTSFQPTFEVIIYHKNYYSLDQIEKAVVSALDWFSGTSEVTVYKTIQFQTSFDADYVQQWDVYPRVIVFEAVVHENQIT
jgi:hypothetical protein